MEFIGRKDKQVKLRGYRIELGEIEYALAEHASVRQAVVAVREDTPGDKRLVAYVVQHADRAVSTGELQNYLRNKVPEYMVPGGYVLLEALPVTASGKVNHKAMCRRGRQQSRRWQAYGPRF
jgi:acyl-coenzyme A synthetase/AMP-(fatty) acid ligase